MQNFRIRVIVHLLFTGLSLMMSIKSIGAQDMLEDMIEKMVISRLVWSPDGTKLAVASYSVDIEGGIHDIKLEILDGATNELITTLQEGGKLIESLAWHPNNVDLWTGDNDGIVRRWNVTNNQLIGTYQLSESAIISLDWDKSGMHLASGGYDNVIRILDTDGNIVNSLDLGATNLPGLAASINWMGYSLDGLTLATSGKNGAVIIWDSKTLTEVSRLPFQYITSAIGDWSPSGAKLATTSNDNTAQIWDMTSEVPLLMFTLQGHTGSVTMVSWNPTGDRLATAGLDGTVRIWNTTDGQPIQTIQAQNLSEVWRVDWSSTGQLAYGGIVILDPFNATPTPPPPVVEFAPPDPDSP